MSIAWVSWMLIIGFMLFGFYKMSGTIRAVWVASWEKERALYLERKQKEKEGKQ